MVSHSVIITSLGASRMYRGIAGYNPTNNLQVTEIGGMERSSWTSWFAGPSLASYLPRITSGLRGTSPDSDVLPYSHAQN
jgi:hypothetical protein